MRVCTGNTRFMHISWWNTKTVSLLNSSTRNRMRLSNSQANLVNKYRAYKRKSRAWDREVIFLFYLIFVPTPRFRAVHTWPIFSIWLHRLDSTPMSCRLRFVQLHLARVPFAFWFDWFGWFNWSVVHIGTLAHWHIVPMWISSASCFFLIVIGKIRENCREKKRREKMRKFWIQRSPFEIVKHISLNKKPMEKGRNSNPNMAQK